MIEPTQGILKMSDNYFETGGTAVLQGGNNGDGDD